jgi:hypothetical protein
MLMVIFGAGASYDSCPTYPPGTPVQFHSAVGLNEYDRPPLADHLFANRMAFAGLLLRYPECQKIAGDSDEGDRGSGLMVISVPGSL